MTTSVSIELPASKSISNRLLLLKHLYHPELQITGLSDAADTRLMFKILSAAHLSDNIDVADAGTVARFISALACTDGRAHIISGTERMHERPMSDLIDALRQMGANITCLGAEGFLPIRIEATHDFQHTIRLNTDISSQFLSSLMMIGPSFPEGLIIELTGNKSSWPYVEMTGSLMGTMGFNTVFHGTTMRIHPKGKVQGRLNSIMVEADWSSAAFFWMAAALGKFNKELFFPGLLPPDRSVQGDAILAHFSEILGLDWMATQDGISLRKGTSAPQVSDVLDFESCPDLALPVITALCALKLRFVVTGVHSLQHKESRRMDALTEALGLCNVSVIAMDDDCYSMDASGFILPENAVICTYDDHRMAMTFGTLSLLGPIKVDNMECVAKSFPGFWNELAKLLTQIMH